MYSTQLDSRRTLGRYALAFLGVAALAACETDRSFAPTTAQPPTSAALAKGKGGGGAGGSLRIALVNKLLGPLSAGGATFTGTKSGQLKFTVTDNGPNDAEPAVGIVEVTGLTGGNYTVCQTVAPVGFIRSTNCPVASLGGNTPPLVTFVNPAEPHAIWAVFDVISKDTIGGATFTMDKNDGSPVITIADNSLLDLDPRPGVFEVKSDKEVVASICMATPPVDRIKNPNLAECNIEALTAAEVAVSDWSVNLPLFVYWSAGTNEGATLDGTFSVTGPNGFSIVVIGNSQYDLAQNSQYYVKLPSAGSYTVCQTVLPAGKKADEQPCRQVSVIAGQWPYAGMFFNDVQ